MNENMDFWSLHPWGEAALAAALLGVCFTLYWFGSKPLTARVESRNGNAEAGQMQGVLAARYWGLLTLGVIPGLVMWLWFSRTPADYGFVVPATAETAWWVLGLAPVLILLNAFSSRNPENLEMYPQIRRKQWTAGTFVQEYTSWFAYLLGYEFLFRGILLFAIARESGAWNAMAVNAAMYALAHLPKGARETIASLPFGFFLSWICLRTGNFWPGLLLHCALAFSNSFFSFWYHPQMQYAGRRQSA